MIDDMCFTHIPICHSHSVWCVLYLSGGNINHSLKVPIPNFATAEKISHGFTQPLWMNAGIAPSHIPGMPASNSGPVGTAFILETT